MPEQESTPTQHPSAQVGVGCSNNATGHNYKARKCPCASCMLKMENMKKLFVTNGPELKTHLLWLQICTYIYILYPTSAAATRTIAVYNTVSFAHNMHALAAISADLRTGVPHQRGDAFTTCLGSRTLEKTPGPFPPCYCA